jgi:hypothetical protein
MLAGSKKRFETNLKRWNELRRALDQGHKTE